MKPRRVAHGTGDIAGVVSLVSRAAALMRGGVPALRVWTVLAEEAAGREAELELPQLLATEMALGADLASDPHFPDRPCWRVLKAAWWTAESSGAPLAETLDRLASSMRALGRVAERRAVLLSGPRATIRLVISLPPAALLLGALLGFDPIRAFSGPIGWLVVALGAVLLVLGMWWSRALLRRLSREDWVAGWEFELVAIALAGGGAPGAALRLAADCADRARAEWVRLESFAAEGAVSTALAKAVSLGVPIGPMLRGEAEHRRDAAQSELERAAERLGVAVLVPLGLCVLPSFVLLGVVPVLLAVLGGAAL